MGLYLQATAARGAKQSAELVATRAQLKAATERSQALERESAARNASLQHLQAQLDARQQVRG